MIGYLLTVAALTRDRMRLAAASNDRGAFSAEYVIWTAALAVVALAVVGSIAVKLTNKEASISLD